MYIKRISLDALQIENKKSVNITTLNLIRNKYNLLFFSNLHEI